MKMVISPAKSLNLTTPLPNDQYTQPQFLQQAQTVNHSLASKPPQVLRKLLSISYKLAELNWRRHQDFTLPFTPENARPAVYAFNGTAYRELDAYSLPKNKLKGLQKCLRILCGLYGILKPLDLIQPYRLEMQTPLQVGPHKNLYEFWGQQLTVHLNRELQEDELLVNLASPKYFKVIHTAHLKVPVITPIFKEWKNGRLRTTGIAAKKARGAMVRYLIDTEAKMLEDLREFNRSGYLFSPEHTLEDNQPIFVR